MNMSPFDFFKHIEALHLESIEITNKNEEATNKAIEAIGSAKSLAETMRQACRDLNATYVQNNDEKRKINREIAISVSNIYRDLSILKRDGSTLRIAIGLLLFINFIFTIIFSFLLFR